MEISFLTRTSQRAALLIITYPNADSKAPAIPEHLRIEDLKRTDPLINRREHCTQMMRYLVPQNSAHSSAAFQVYLEDVWPAEVFDCKSQSVRRWRRNSWRCDGETDMTSDRTTQPPTYASMRSR